MVRLDPLLRELAKYETGILVLDPGCKPQLSVDGELPAIEIRLAGRPPANMSCQRWILSDMGSCLPSFTRPLILSLALSQVSVGSFAADFSVKGQLSATLQIWNNESSNPLVGALYIPELSLAEDLKKGRLDAELALTAAAFGPLGEPSEIGDSADLDLYRGWIRYSTDQSEVRAGLQRISFGPAFLIRPLMWFDRIDPRDPLQITEGVYGLLGRHYFLNSANLWVWALYGNDDPKGWEFLPTEDNTVEVGGRFQGPLLSGEIGVSTHYRQISFFPLPGTEGDQGDISGAEYRLGLDGRWDVEVGLWFEAVLVENDVSESAATNRLLTLGADYTFGLGNGLHVLGEQFFGDATSTLSLADSNVSISAVTADYPLNLADRLAAFVTYSWQSDWWSRFVQWGHSFNSWNLYVMGFWNDETARSPLLSDGDFANRGTGIQLLFVFSH